MTAEASELLRRALALPEDERAALANTLLDSLDTNPESVEKAWEEEIARRIEALKSDHRSVGGVPSGTAAHGE